MVELVKRGAAHFEVGALIIVAELERPRAQPTLMCPGSLRERPIVQRMLGLQSRGNVEFLLNHVDHRDRVPQRQGSAEKTVQQREFLELPVEICLECFHGGLRSTPAPGLTFRQRIGSSAGNTKAVKYRRCIAVRLSSG